MKLYLVERKSHIVIVSKEDDEGFEISAVKKYEGTQADARKTRIALEEPLKEIKAAKRPKVVVEEVEIPTNKEGLLSWLNANAV